MGMVLMVDHTPEDHHLRAAGALDVRRHTMGAMMVLDDLRATELPPKPPLGYDSFTLVYEYLPPFRPSTLSI